MYMYTCIDKPLVLPFSTQTHDAFTLFFCVWVDQNGFDKSISSISLRKCECVCMCAYGFLGMCVSVYVMSDTNR